MPSEGREPTSAGAPSKYRLPPSSHLLLTYRGAEPPSRCVLAFLTAGLDGNRRLLYLHDGTDSSGVVGRLREADLDVEQLLSSGQLHLRAAEEFYLYDGTLAPDRLFGKLRGALEDARRDGFDGLQVVGETGWAAYREGIPSRLIEYERRVDEMLSDLPVDALCLYPADQWDDPLLDAMSEHHGDRLHQEETDGEGTEGKAHSRRFEEPFSYFREGVEHIDEIFWITPPDKSEMLYISPAYESLWERSPRSLYEDPTSWLDAIHPDDRENVQERLPLQEEGEYDEEYRIVRPSGEVRWVHDRAYPITDETGDVVRIVGVVSDITERKRAQREREEARSLLEAVVEGTTDAVYLKDREGRYLLLNDATARIAGVEGRDQMEGRTDEDLFPPETAENISRDDQRVMDTGETVRFEERLEIADGNIRVYETVKAPYRNAGGDVVGVIGVSRDVTEKHRAKEELERAQKKFETVFDITPLALTVSTLEEGRFLEINEGFEQLYGYEREAVLGRTVDELGLWTAPGDREQIVRQLKEDGAVSGMEVKLRTKSGDLVEALFAARRLTIDGRDCMVTAVHDITDRIAAERELERLALHDPLTGLHDRRVFEDRLDHALERARREGTHLGVLFLDIDRFKVINDSLGHSVGDSLLQEVADRLRACVRDADTVARMGGDEFAVLLEAVEGETEAEEAARRVAQVFQQPFHVGDAEIPAEVSIGLALSHHEEVQEAEDLLRFSDIAMYRMKEIKGTGFKVFDPSSDQAEAVRFQRERRLEEALEKEEFEVWYQPVLDLRAKRIVGAEALVRWRHPEDGVRPASAFVPLAEESGLIEVIDQRVLGEACRRAAVWHQSAGETGFWMSVNLSAGRYRHPELTEDVRVVLEESGLPPDLLQLEVSESLITSGQGKLQDLRTDGVRIVIDDFGTGYSSFHTFERLEVDALKIDQTFVARLDDDARSHGIVESMIVLARRLDLEVIAEGIETQTQLDHLQELGCALGQGYLFGRPVPHEEFEDLLTDGVLP